MVGIGASVVGSSQGLLLQLRLQRPLEFRSYSMMSMNSSLRAVPKRSKVLMRDAYAKLNVVLSSLSELL
jgi:hypothetical protein